RRHEQRPAVLEVRDRHHAEDAEEEDEPAIVEESPQSGLALHPRCKGSHWHLHFWGRDTRSLPGPVPQLLGPTRARAGRAQDVGGLSPSISFLNGITPGMTHRSHISSTLL